MVETGLTYATSYLIKYF